MSRRAVNVDQAVDFRTWKQRKRREPNVSISFRTRRIKCDLAGIDKDASEGVHLAADLCPTKGDIAVGLKTAAEPCVAGDARAVGRQNRFPLRQQRLGLDHRVLEMSACGVEISANRCS